MARRRMLKGMAGAAGVAMLGMSIAADSAAAAR